jgi:UDP-GlcNAc:undecaprenyl-phosphate GlcNAc-1-phosphate transferase
LIKVAYKFSIVDVPDGKLKVHTQSTPYLGGLAVYLGFLIASSLIMPFENQFFLFIVASTILLFVGLLDDLIVLTPAQKFFGQFLAALCYVKAGFYLKCQFFSNAWNIFISFFWFLGFINAFNLIDVMDGLAVITALFIALAYGIFALLLGNGALWLLLIAFMASVAGFLLFNKPPACIYLGDSGSLFLGGFLACVPFAISWSEYNIYGYFVPLIVSAVPLLECGTLIIVRTYNLIPFYLGSPHHFSIILQKHGWSKNAILLLSAAFTGMCTVLAVSLFLNYLSFGMVVCCGLVLLLFWYLNLIR